VPTAVTVLVPVMPAVVMVIIIFILFLKYVSRQANNTHFKRQMYAEAKFENL
jgi:uncharacterized membrane protein